jgi:exopolysaccharide biosynthesis polyprenyl glycosylphosphotransferase
LDRKTHSQPLVFFAGHGKTDKNLTTARQPVIPDAEPFPAREPVHSLAGQDITKDREYFFIRTPRFARLLTFIADLLFVSLTAVVSFFWFCLEPLRMGAPALPWGQTSAVLLLYSALIVLACRGLHLYIRPRRSGMFGDLATISKAVALATALMLAYMYLSRTRISFEVIVFTGGLDLAILIGYRAVRMKVTERRIAAGRGIRNVLIVGAGKVGQALASHMDHNKPLGFVVKGFLDSDHHQDPRLLGKVEDFSNIVRRHFVDDVFITIPSERQVVRNLVATAQEHGVTVKVIPELFDGLGLQAPIDYVGKFPTMELHREPIPRAGLWAKRALDIAVSGVALVITAPVMLVLAMVVKLDSRGPVLYRSERVGRKGRRFTCYKFRSMVSNADVLKQDLRQKNYRLGPTFKIDNDPRVTGIGRILREYSLDELPQLWNIFRGDMSLVGPRPHPVDDFEQYDPEHMVRLHVKPGLTGLWQVIARRDPSFQKNMELDLEYIENWTLALDFKILLRTLPAVLRGGGE